MGKILGVVVKWLQQKGAKYEKDESREVVRIRMEGEHATYQAVFDADEKEQRLVLYVLFPINIPGPKRPVVAEYLTRANHGLVIGNFEMDKEDGDLRFRVAVDTTGSELAPKMVENMALSAGLPFMEKYFPGIMAICYGERTPEEAIEAIT